MKQLYLINANLAKIYSHFYNLRFAVTAAERKDREASNTPVYIVKLRDSELILDSTASIMLHVQGNPNPSVEL